MQTYIKRVDTFILHYIKINNAIYAPEQSIVNETCNKIVIVIVIETSIIYRLVIIFILVEYACKTET